MIYRYQALLAYYFSKYLKIDACACGCAQHTNLDPGAVLRKVGIDLLDFRAFSNIGKLDLAVCFTSI